MQTTIFCNIFLLFFTVFDVANIPEKAFGSIRILFVNIGFGRVWRKLQTRFSRSEIFQVGRQSTSEATAPILLIFFVFRTSPAMVYTSRKFLACTKQLLQTKNRRIFSKNCNFFFTLLSFYEKNFCLLLRGSHHSH